MMRAAITASLVAVILLAIGFGSATVSRYRLAAETTTTINIPCIADEAERERIRAILLDAMDRAFKDQLMHLYETWMKDDRGQPERATIGAQRALKAYLHARAGAMKYNPPICR